MLDDSRNALLQMCKEQEDKYKFEEITQQDICQLGEYLKGISLQLDRPVAIEAALGNFVVFRFYPEGRGIHEETWIAGKRNTVMAFGLSSKHMMLKMLGKGLTQSHTFAALDPGKFALSGGGFPLKLKNGLLVGSICASGLRDDDDHNVLIQALDKFFQSK
ncbi:heme-binding protein [Paenibacillus sp. P46E]|uniref:heme-binding protein n=1 Tax=Paenibacillus sp. P46E TaxID=1349436 RepID=UPI00093A8F89|nr:heme-binding protein [Paenibacillus sp. P46E]OKP94240.1 hypothetical protein A3849_29685 [Paenibacillus sp. P46E]